MNKSELIARMAKDVKITKVQATKVVASFQDAVKGTLKKRDKLTLVGFGTFKVVERKARTGRNPQTGKPIKIAAKKVAKFKAGAALSKSIQ